MSQHFSVSNGSFNGYCLFQHEDATELRIYDMGQEIESIVNTLQGDLISENNLHLTEDQFHLERYIEANEALYNYISARDQETRWSDLIDYICHDLPPSFECTDAKQMVWAFERKKNFAKGLYEENNDIIPFYLRQEFLRKKIKQENTVEIEDIRLLAGADVAYDDANNLLVAAITVHDIQSMDLIEEVTLTSGISFPYIPGLFSFREVPPLLRAFEKLENKPDVIICDGHGVAHPKGIGMASHLGVELKIPTVGCAKKRLIGAYDKSELSIAKGSELPLRWCSEKVGVALRTQENINPYLV